MTSKAPTSKSPSSKTPTSKAPSSKTPSRTLKNTINNDAMSSRQNSIRSRTMKIQNTIVYKIFQTEDELKIAIKFYKNSAFMKQTYGLIENWKFSKKIKSMAHLFDGYDLNELDLSNWDVSNIRDMKCLFYNAKNIHFDFSKWNVSKVKNMEWMFENCHNLTSKFDNWNVANCTHMRSMFANCHDFDCDLNTWIVKPSTDMRSMFANCNKFNTVNNCYNWYLTYGVTRIFTKSQLKKIDQIRESNILYVLNQKGIQLDANTIVEVIDAIN